MWWFLLFVLLFYGSSNVYIGYKLNKVINSFLPNFKSWIFIVMYFIISVSFVLSFFDTKGFKDFFNFIGSYWLGFFAIFLMFFLISDIIVFILKYFKIISFTAKSYQIIGISVVILSFLMGAYGMYNFTKLKIVNYNVEISSEKLKDEITIVQISDAHLGSLYSESRLEGIVEKINELKPDLVTITGDLFDDDYHAIKDPKRVIELFNKIESKYGVYAALGNHDAGRTFKDLMKLSEESNIKFLNDTHINIDNKFILVGRVDPSPIGGFDGLKRAKTDEVLKDIDKSLPIVVMDHNPANYKDYLGKVDLVLSGHTHKGQIFPSNIITKLTYDIDYGHVKKENTNIIVSSGVGAWMLPMRIASNNEIVKIVLRNN